MDLGSRKRDKDNRIKLWLLQETNNQGGNVRHRQTLPDSQETLSTGRWLHAMEEKCICPKSARKIDPTEQERRPGDPANPGSNNEEGRVGQHHDDAINSHPD